MSVTNIYLNPTQYTSPILDTKKNRHNPPDQRPHQSTNHKHTKNKDHGGKHIKELLNTQIPTSGIYRLTDGTEKYKGVGYR